MEGGDRDTPVQSVLPGGVYEFENEFTVQSVLPIWEREGPVRSVLPGREIDIINGKLQIEGNQQTFLLVDPRESRLEQTVLPRGTPEVGKENISILKGRGEHLKERKPRDFQERMAALRNKIVVQMVLEDILEEVEELKAV